MNVKLSVAFLSGLSVCLSMSAYAVADGTPSDYINWSYAMGETQPMTFAGQPDSYNDTISNDVMLTDIQVGSPARAEDTFQSDITCTEGCPGRPEIKQKPLVLTYEDEAAPLADRADTTFIANDRFETQAPISVREKVKKQETKQEIIAETQSKPAQAINMPPQIDTRYIESSAKVQYPITRQYPISVQYPVTIQRNMTVEQPVIMQQPVIVRRPVVMQQDITVQRQPTVIQHQPVVMQQNPAFVQQQPVYIQAPAGAVSPSVLSGLTSFQAPMIQQMPNMLPIPAQQSMPVQPMVAPTESRPAQAIQPVAAPVQPDMTPSISMAPVPYYMGQPQQYQVQGQIQAQPVYAPNATYMPMTQPVMPGVSGAMPTQPTY